MFVKASLTTQALALTSAAINEPSISPTYFLLFSCSRYDDRGYNATDLVTTAAAYDSSGGPFDTPYLQSQS